MINIGIEHLAEVMKRGEKSLVGKQCLDSIIDKEVIQSTIAKI